MIDIGIIIPGLSKYGGAERYLIECLIRWQEKHRLSVYACDFDVEMLEEHGVRECVRLIKLSGRFDAAHETVLNGTLLPKVWEQEIGRHDIYHTHLWPTHLIDVHPMVWFPHEPLRIISDLRFGQHIDEQLARNIHLYPKATYDSLVDTCYEATMRALAQFDKTGRPDRIVANSRYTAQCLEEVYRRPVTDVVYPGVNLLDPIHLPASDNIVLTVGQLWPHKRIRLLLEAVALVPAVELYVVGSGPDRNQLQAIARNLGVEDRVFFLSGLNNEELRILFSRAMCVAFTPVREPFGIVALEAMAAGKPLIAVKEGGYLEIIDDECAMLVPPWPTAIAEKIKTLHSDSNLRRRMGAAGVEKVKEFTWDRTAKELLSIIEDEYALYKSQSNKPVELSDSRGPLVGIHYYGWYREGYGNAHWNDTADSGGITDMPLLGYYESTDGELIDQHLSWMEEAGIDFSVLHLHVDDKGCDPHELAAFDTIFRKAHGGTHRIKFAICLCSYTDNVQALSATIKMIRSIFVTRESYLRYVEKPVLFIFWPGTKDGDGTFCQCLADASYDFVRIAATLRLYDPRTESMRTFGLFDAFSLYSPLELSAADKWERLWQLAYDRSDAGRLSLQIATVCPGYDDAHLLSHSRAGNPYRTIGRDNGRIYCRCWDFVFSQKKPPEIVLITSMNEFHENTHIEPCRTYGRLYVDLTRSQILRFREHYRRAFQDATGQRSISLG
jgi:glycosyltransferase involved in cell wall biosynthesis